MSIQSTLDRVATALACLSLDDSESLSTLAEYFEDLVGAAGDDGVLSGPILRAAECAQRLAREEGGDHAQDLELLEQIVTWAQEALESIEDGGTVLEFGAEGSAKNDNDQVDHELLSMFLDSAQEALAKVEEELLALEKDPAQTERITEVRGVVHTLKGECGVIPLPDAQSLLHSAETALDNATSAGAELPVDLFLSLLDWFKAYLYALAEDPNCTAPEHVELRSQIEAAASSSSSPAPVASPTAAPKNTASEDSMASKIDPDELVQFPDEILNDSTLPEFLSEARSHIEDSEAALLEIETDPEDTELIDRIFRAFHTIKGVAGFMNMEDMVAFAHNAEALLDEFRKGRMICTAAHISLVFEACDCMSGMLDYLAGEDPPNRREVYQLIDRLKGAADGETPINAVDPQQVLPELQSLADDPIQPVAAAQEPADKRASMLGEMLLERDLIEPEDLEQALAEQRRLQAQGVHKRIGQILSDRDMVSLDSLKSMLLAQSDGKAAEGGEFPFAKAVVDSGLMSKTEVQAAVKAQPKKDPGARKKKVNIEQTVKVATGRLDTLVDMVGELVIAQQMVTQDPELAEVSSPRLQRNLTQVAKITRDLQESAMSLRMVTLRSTFQKMTRLVRDVSSKAGKLVDFVVSGEDTELDRNVVEEIGDPLVHLIRNAIDHGLESPDERLERNKEPRGRVELNAYHQGGSIVIAIRDDGNGMNRERILAKAVEREIMDQAEADEMSDSEVYKLIFQPGFSTADQVTDISGRGVGMDVVRRNIEAMRGKIDIDSKPGEGTAFLLRLPLTMAIIDGMIVRVGPRRYVIPTLGIEQSFRPDTNSCHRVMHDGEMVDVRGKLLPIHRLRDVFELNEGTTDLTEGILVLVEGANGRACLLVDEILGQQQVVIKNLGKALPPAEGISGGAILGNGRVALILDIDTLLHTAAQPATF